MFKKFDEKESVSSIQQLKSSLQKGIRVKLLEVRNISTNRLFLTFTGFF